MSQDGLSQNFDTMGDQRLITKAITERWPIEARMRHRVVEHTFDVLTNSEKEDSLRMTAANTLVKIDGLNLKQKELEIRVAPKHVIHTNMSLDELEERVKVLQEELGFEVKHTQPALVAMVKEDLE